MFKKFVFSALLLSTTAGTAHADWFTAIPCYFASEALNAVGGLSNVLPSITSAEKQVFVEYIDHRKEYFCNNPDDLIRIALALKSLKDNSRDEAVRNMSDYTRDNDGDTIVDAFRHSRATAISTRIMGADWGLKLANAHESDADDVPGDGEWESHQMDLHNNQVGYKVHRILYTRLGYREPSDGEIEAELRSRCYHFVNRELDSTTYANEVNANLGLVYIAKANVPVEQRGVNCAVPILNPALSFLPAQAHFPNDKPLTISGTSSLPPVAGRITSYKWTFQKPVMVCNDEKGCIQTSTLTAWPWGGEFQYPKIDNPIVADDELTSGWRVFANKIYYPSKVYLLSGEPMSVSLEAANQHGEWSNATTAWINNWGPMVPVLQLLLN